MPCRRAPFLDRRSVRAPRSVRWDRWVSNLTHAQTVGSHRSRYWPNPPRFGKERTRSRTCQQPATLPRARRKRRAGGSGGAGELVARGLLSSAGPSNQGTGASSRVVAFQLLAISCLQAPAIAAIVKRARIALTQPQPRPRTPRRGSRQEDKVTPGTLGSLGKISRLHPNRPAIGHQTCAAPSWARRALRGGAGRRRP